MPTRYIKIVVTDDQGRYVIPGLPKANYDVWVRGYGLVDFAKGANGPGKDRRFDGRAGAKRRGCSAILSCRLLVLDAERFPAHLLSRGPARWGRVPCLRS